MRDDLISIQNKCKELVAVDLSAGCLAEANFIMDLVAIHRMIEEHMDRVHIAGGGRR